MVERARRAGSVVVALAAGFGVLGAAGCGGGDSGYANKPRPPAPIVVSARIGESAISVSPRSFGAGPIQLIVTNQTSKARELTLETDEIGGDQPGIRQNSGPINPGDTAQLNADLRSGTYRLGVDGDGVSGASLHVGRERPSAQNDLLQP